MNTIIFPGTFDPITLGHLDLIQRAVKLYEHVIIAVASSSSKSPIFSLDHRLKLIQQLFAEFPNVSAIGYSGLIVDCMREHQVRLLLRGIRSTADLEHEFQLATMNRYMYPEMETVFLAPDPKFSHVSSTIVREIAKMGGDLKPFVPEIVIQAIEKHNR